MNGIFLATWVKLRRPALLGGTYAAIASLTGLFTTLLFTTAQDLPGGAQGGSGGGPGGGGPGAGVGLADLAASGGATEGLANAVTLLGVVALCVAAAQIAGEHTQGTIRNLLVRQPNRARLLAGTWAAVATFTAGAVLVAATASVAAAFALAPGQGIDTGAWTGGAGLRANAESIALVLGAVLGYATIGVVLGLVLRSAVQAIALGVAWLLVVELVLTTVLDGAGRWLPGQLLAAMATGGTEDVTLGAAAGTMSAFLVAIVVAAGVVFDRRDVVA
jgi:ABC-2 type transport system permease protein